jgi:hypothetical protein
MYIAAGCATADLTCCWWTMCPNNAMHVTCPGMTQSSDIGTCMHCRRQLTRRYVNVPIIIMMMPLNVCA